MSKPLALRALALLFPALVVAGCDRDPVRPADAGGPSAASAPGSVAPPAPVGVAATFRADSFAVQVEWSHDGSQLAESWRVQRREPGTEWMEAGAGTGAGARFVDAAFVVGPPRTLEYRVLVCNGPGCGVSLVARADVPALPAPENLTAVPSGDSILVSWDTPADGSWITQVVRRTASTGFAPRLTTAPGASSFADRGTDGVTYYYMVRTLVPGSPPAGRYRQSAWSQEAAATPGGSGTGGPPVARADSGVAASASSATVYGAVTPNGQATTAHFQWSTSPSFASPSASSPASVGSGFSPAPASATLTGLAAGTRYYYRLIATSAAGADTSAALPLELAPPAPAVVNASFTRPGYEVALSWTAPGAEWFRVDRRPAGTDAWSTLVDGYTATWLRDGGFQLDSVYRLEYRVMACNALGCSTAQTAISTIPLPVPSNLSALVGRDEVRLQWDGNGQPPSVFYQVRRATPGTAFRPRVTTAPGVTSFVDDQVALDSTYVYEVRALLPVAGQTSNRRSAWSGPLAVVPGTVGATPGVTTDSARLDGARLLLFGTVDVRAGNTRASFQFSGDPSLQPAGGAAVALDPAARGLTRVSASIPRPAGPLYYRLVASDGAGTTYGAIRSAITAPVALGAPTELRARLDGETYAVELRWSPVPGADHYRVTRVEAGERTRSYPAGADGFRDLYFGLEVSQQLAYVVRACTAAGCGAASDTARITTAPLVQPGALEATPVDSTRVRLAWDDRSTGESGFIVERRDPGSSRFVPITRVRVNGANGYVDTGLMPGRTYGYRVLAYRDEETRKSLPSNEVAVTTVGAGPGSAPTATSGPAQFTSASGGVYATLSGTVDPGGRPTAVWFQIGTSATLTGADSLAVGTRDGTSPGAATRNVTGLTRGTTYYYRLVAANDMGRSNGAIRSFLFDTPPAPGALQVSFQPAGWSFAVDYSAGNAVVAYRSVAVDGIPMAEPYLAPILSSPAPVPVDVALCNAFGCGPAATASESVPAFPPPAFSATPAAGRIELAWQDQSGVTYKTWSLARRVAGTSAWTQLFGSSGATSYTDTNVTAGQQYEYRLIERIDGGDASEFRTAATVTATATAQ